MKCVPAAAAMACGVSQAAVLQFDAKNQLTGATGVQVNGAFYDVTFAEGSCYQLIPLCTNGTDFVFDDLASATAASEAPQVHVFVDAFDTDPSRIAVVPDSQRFINAWTPCGIGSGATSGTLLLRLAAGPGFAARRRQAG